MYSLIRHLGLREALLQEAPSLFLSMLVAELFYKFHSFALECGGFLATWIVISYGFRTVQSRFQGRAKNPT